MQVAIACIFSTGHADRMPWNCVLAITVYICIQFFVFILDLFANLFAFLFGDIYLKLTEFLSQQ